MFEALTQNATVENTAAYYDAQNNLVEVGPSAYNINLDVVDNVDKTWLRLYGEQIPDKANVPSAYLFTRTIKTWFDVPFTFNVTVNPYLPKAEIIRSTEYAKAIDTKVFGVTLDARIVEQAGKKVYTVVNSDLAKYLNVTGEVNPTQKVTFAVQAPALSTLENTVVDVEPLPTGIDNPLVGTINAYLQKSKAVLHWSDTNTEIKVKATLWSGAYPIDYATLVLNVEDPLTFKVGNIPAEREARKATEVKVYSGFDLRSSAQTMAGVPYHTQNLILTNAETFADAIDPKAVEAYGVKISLALQRVYEDVGEGVPYDDTKYTWNKETGILTLLADDAVKLHHNIVAKIQVTFEHEVHNSESCKRVEYLEVRFKNKGE
jgi:hypothetical protein